MTLRKRTEKILEIERGSSRSHSMENFFGRGYGPVVRQTTELMNCQTWNNFK
jgi:hypothetical protein